MTVQVAKDDARLNDAYELGWRVVTMALHPDGKQITVLMEKIETPARG